MATIVNGRNIPINVQTGTVPNVEGALRNWFQPTTFIKIVKSVVDFEVVEAETPINFRGVVMPLTGRRLEIKPEGQRKWNFIHVFTDTALPLEPDEIISYLGIRYRVMSKRDFLIYGYIEYELCEAYTE